MVTTPEVLLVSALGAVTSLVLLGRVLSGRVRGLELWSCGIGAAVVGAALLIETGPAVGRAPLQVLVVALVGLAAVPPLVERRHGAAPRARSGGGLPLLVVALATTALMVNLVHNPLAPADEVYARVLAPALWVLVTLVALLGGLTRRGFVLGALGAVGTVCALMPLYPTPTTPCLADKCSVLGSLMRGPFGSENLLAVVAASAVFLAWSLGRDPVAAPAGVLGVVALLAAGGRGSLVAVGVGVLGGLLVTTPPVRKRLARASRATLRLLAGAVSAAFAVVGVALVAGARPDDLSGRGAVWQAGLEAVRERPLLGVGLSRWDGYDGVAAVSHHYPHSEYLLILFAAGAVGLGLYVVLTAAFLASATSTALVAGSGGAGLVGQVLFLLTVGLVEVVLNPLSVDGLTWLLLAHVLPAPVRRRPPADASPGVAPVHVERS